MRVGRDSVGRKLIDVPGYTFRVFVTSCGHAPQEIWRDYNRRADMENRIAELKHDLGADGFCLKQFFATEAAFRAVLLLFNLAPGVPTLAGLPGYREPATIRAQVLTCGAILGQAGRRTRGDSPIAKLGRVENENSLAGQYLELANSNFAEVGTGTRNLIQDRTKTTLQNAQPGGQSTLNFGIQVNPATTRETVKGEVVRS